ncbi:DUF5343 domain-containing protein [Mycobacteroides abscessus subsp. abscessus]|uniref:DUF5343 domain-containing protein n=2 Tax=Mycobacteroides abscessus TaxID=36809 RepID=UPI000241C284|nr:DUF5343 domain-containing protein [Mycobacteroides abscessus]EHM17612.1 hypothetical protein MBOL_41980 [Mycobacteroides abscessus subsp. bolletii BD]MBN7457272.1 DUF5343 domain-containing protein [Mycobacteroides abscessus subsp. abscessus]MBN7546938.1 DUF5343 domain-containing protein [Mycobacteroides abscessus subsp. abscessus]MBN7571058.1 DUF5343 domain-containing protein [Mycobacteroides abscessus subsp. abscessus]ORA30795.1 hypothetical protein BST18_04750 [Mycobacteroides abscessus s
MRENNVMAGAEFPISLAPARLADIFQSISTAGTPPKFNNEFLKTTLGYSSSNDRAIISILKKLDFINAGGVPTQRYNDFKGHDGGRAVAAGLREGWAQLFMADGEIYKKPVAEVQKRVATLTGANELSVSRMATTFVKLCAIADWSRSEAKQEQPDDSSDEGEPDEGRRSNSAGSGADGAGGSANIRLHHDIHIHLPATSDPAVYRAVFQAIKAELT